MIMKKILIIVFVLLYQSFIVFSQNGFDNDFFISEPVEKKTKFPSFAINISYLLWMDEPVNIDLNTGNNRSFSMNLERNLLKNKEKFNIGSGIYVGFLNMHSAARNWHFDSTGKVLDAYIIPDSVKYKKNKMTFAYMGLPVNFKFRFGKDLKKAKYLNLGFKAGFLLSASNKFVQGDDKLKSRLKDNLSSFQYAVTASVGTKRAYLSWEYYLSSLFDEKNAPDTKAMTIGLSFML
jgi:uncharacterized protein YxeA